MARAACAAWPGFAAELQDETGQSIDFRDDGAVFIARPGEEEFLQIRYDQRLALGETVDRLSADQVRDLEPGLGPNVIGGVFAPAIMWVDPVLTCRALARAIEVRGGEICPHTPVETVAIADNRTTGVTSANGSTLQTDTVILAAGLFAGCGLSPLSGTGWKHPCTRPVKGHMLALAGPTEQPIWHLLIRRQGSILPRGGGRIVVGVTREDAGLDASVDPDTIAMLHRDAAAYVPHLSKLEITRAWSGLRPYPADGLAMIGRTHIDGLYLANGLGASGYAVGLCRRCDRRRDCRCTNPLRSNSLFPLRFDKSKETA